MNIYNFRKNIRIIGNTREIYCNTKITNAAYVLLLVEVCFGSCIAMKIVPVFKIMQTLLNLRI